MGKLGNLVDRLAQATNHLGMEVRLRRIRRSDSTRKVIYFLHIGKAAGSQIKQAIAQINGAEKGIHIHALTHDEMLVDVPDEAEYFFSIRDPAARFRSGFYSRKRRGRPLNDIAWTAHEEMAFSTFEHANDLAEALFAGGMRGMQAVAAMKSIRHTAQDQVDWFALVGDIFSVRPPVWVIRQEHFDEDIERFYQRAGIGTRPELKRDPKGSHANDYSDVPDLSERALSNLKRWYSQDYALYEAVETWMEQGSQA
ncbi:MAG: sulfotransferase family 2 domain-containing protein [Pseudomonadota bacterium]